MKRLANLSRRARWAVPAGAVALTGGVMAGSVVSVAQAAPALPARTPAQLLASVARTASVPPLTGTVVETASLGLPQLPGRDDPASIASLLTGSHTIKVAEAGPARVRISLPQDMSESDLVRNGRDVWLWQSSTNTATHVMLPQGEGGQPAPRMAPRVPPTPQQVAHQVLAKVGPTTAVSVDSNVTVAGRPAYRLVLAPKSPGSLISQVRIAIDGKNDVPLGVQVFAKGATSPAFSVGFTSVSFAAPPASEFSFTPPAGAKVMQQAMPAGKAPRAGLASGSSMIGKGWLAVADLPASALTTSSGPLAPGASGSAPGAGSGAVINALLKSARPVHGAWGSGRLLRTSLVSMLITGNRVLIGPVQPGVLYQAAAHAASAGESHAAPAAPVR